MVVYRLHYFDIRGAGETIRMMFHYAGVKFEEIVISMEDWPKIKPTIPFGFLPMLEVDGKKLVQSQAIYRFLGKKFGLYGSDVYQRARTDEVADLFNDFNSDLREYFGVVSGYRKGDEKQIKKSAVEPAVDKFMPLFSRFMKEAGGPFLTGKSVTFADFRFADMIFTLRNFAPELLDDYMDLSALTDRVLSLPKLKKYIQSRPSKPV